LTGQIGLTVALSIMLFLGFAVRNLYFIHFELAWQGSTPGKRAVESVWSTARGAR